MKITIIDDNFTFLESDKSNPKSSYNLNEQNQIKEQQQDAIRKAISKLFYNYPQKTSFFMTKTHQHNNYGIYKAHVNTDMLGNEKFIVAIVPNDNLSIGSSKLLENLRWISFQTRETKNLRKEFNGLELEQQSYVSTDIPLLKDKIHYEKKTKISYLYVPENLSMKIEIIPLKEDDVYTYENASGNVITALNIFSTVITLNN